MILLFSSFTKKRKNEPPLDHCDLVSFYQHFYWKDRVFFLLLFSDYLVCLSNELFNSSQYTQKKHNTFPIQTACSRLYIRKKYKFKGNTLSAKKMRIPKWLFAFVFSFIYFIHLIFVRKNLFYFHSRIIDWDIMFW